MADVVTVWNPFIITNGGLDLRQAAIATGKSVAFNYAKIGQGVPSTPANIPLMTDIVAPAQQVPVVRSESNGVTHFVGVRIDNMNFAQPILMREIGLFASIDGGAPILYGYTYATQGYDSVPAGNISHYIWTVGIDTVLSRAQSITFTYDGSTVYASYDDIDQLINEFDDFKEEIMATTVQSFKADGETLYHLLNIGYIDGADGKLPAAMPYTNFRLQAETLNLNPYSFEPYKLEPDGARFVFFEGYASIEGDTLILN